MSAESYNKKQYDNGKLTGAHLAQLVEHWQRHHDLVVDGYAGPNTLATITKPGIDKAWPLPLLSDGREPVLTSGFHTENPSRPTHDGIDLFYKWLDSDPDVPVGDGGAIKRNGKRRWWYPPGAAAVAAATGVVQIAGLRGTGWRCWIDHGNGERTGYFHGEALLVKQGQVVSLGTPVLVVGHSPAAWDAKHLHFEVSPTDHYAPKNPRIWLQGASFFTQ